MRDQWYGDNRDLVKWAVLVHSAKKHQSSKSSRSPSTVTANRCRRSPSGERSRHLGRRARPLPDVDRIEGCPKDWPGHHGVQGAVHVDQHANDGVGPRDQYINQVIARLSTRPRDPLIAFFGSPTPVSPHNGRITNTSRPKRWVRSTPPSKWRRSGALPTRTPDGRLAGGDAAGVRRCS